MCIPGRFTLERRSSEVMFVIDRSSSMGFTLDGRPAFGTTPTRWRILRDAFSIALAPVDRTLRFGAKFYPRVYDPSQPPPAGETCITETGVDISPATSNLLRRRVRRRLSRRGSRRSPRRLPRPVIRRSRQPRQSRWQTGALTRSDALPAIATSLRRWGRLWHPPMERRARAPHRRGDASPSAPTPVDSRCFRVAPTLR